MNSAPACDFNKQVGIKRDAEDREDESGHRERATCTSGPPPRPQNDERHFEDQQHESGFSESAIEFDGWYQ